jgi:hypothetical protein
VDATALVGAINAVIGDAGAFADLQAGRLGDIPDAGGLDFLTAASVSESPVAETAAELAPSAGEDDAAQTLAAVRAKLERAQELLRSARARADSADQVLADAKERLAASQKLFERAQEDAENAKSQLRDAERSVLDLQ